MKKSPYWLRNAGSKERKDVGVILAVFLVFVVIFLIYIVLSSMGLVPERFQIF